MKTKPPITKEKPLGQMTFAQAVKAWKKARREYFLELSRGGMTYEEIGALVGMTRQGVGFTIGKK